MTDTLQYVHLKCDEGRRARRPVYRIVDDKIVDGAKLLILLTVDPKGYGHYVEAYPDEVTPVDREVVR